MEPLVPRLHLKDTKKGGPKPPPRNKMAIYEELATPSSRLSDGSAAMMPLQNGSGQMGLSGSSGNGGGGERRVVSSFYGPPASTPRTPTLISSCPSDVVLNNITANAATRTVGYVTTSVSGNSLVTSRSNSFPQSNFVHFERPSNEDELEITVPSSTRQGESLDSGTKQRAIDLETINQPAMNSSMQSQQVFCKNRLKRASFPDLGREGHAKMLPANGQSSSRGCYGSSKRLASVSTVTTHVLSHESSKSLLNNGASETSKNVPAFSSHNSSVADGNNRSLDVNYRRTKTSVEENNGILEDSATEQPKVLGNSAVPLLRTESCAGSSIADNNGVLGNNSHCAEESENKSLQAGVLHKNENASGATVLTSVISSPDDVMLMIGQENFWKIRRTLVNQQRIFSFQVFELHRLMQQLQRSLVGSAQNFIDDTLCLQKGFHEASNKEDLLLPPPPPPPPPPLRFPPHAQLRPPPPPVPGHPNKRPKTIATDSSILKMPFPPFFYDSERSLGGPYHGNTYASSLGMANKIGTGFNAPPLPPPPPPPPPIQPDDLRLKTAISPVNSLGKHPFPPLNYSSNKILLPGHHSSKSNVTCPETGTPIGNSLGKMLPSCFYPQLENQLLVPVLSSEGLVYDPYTGPCPPNPGFMAHLCGSCGSMNVPADSGSCFLNAAYGIPVSQQGKGVVHGIPIELSYLGPYGFSSTNPSAQEALEHSVGTESFQFLVEDRSSCLPCFSSHQKSGCCNGRTVPGSNGIVRQGSTGSSSVKSASQDALPLFPMEPATAQELEVPTFDSGCDEKQTRAIKAVPREGRLATESAMRIFQSIQEEQRQNELATVSKLQV